jgi:flagellar FliJ protein
MGNWARSLIRISNYEAETLQKGLAIIVNRRTHLEMKLATLDAQSELEIAGARSDHLRMAQLPQFLSGQEIRKNALLTELDDALNEEAAIRDQLAQAFENLKKFETVAETARLHQLAAIERSEQAALDEAALRSHRAHI